MQELAARLAGAPDLDLGRIADLGGMHLGDHRWHDMARQEVEIVAGPIEIGRHRADEVRAVLAAIGLAELDAGDLGDRVPLIGGLELALEQRLLGHRLRRELGIDAAGAEEQELLHADLLGRADDVRLDHQVVVEEIRRVAVIGQDAADPRRRDHDHLRPVGREPTFDLRLPAEIALRLGRGQQRAWLALEPAQQRAADHAAMACDPDPLAGQIETALRRRVSHGCGGPRSRPAADRP